MPGNKNSGRKVKYLEDTKEIHFPLEITDSNRLEKLAQIYTNNNTTDLIRGIVKTFIQKQIEKGVIT